jgi:hypothetical protein
LGGGLQTHSARCGNLFGLLGYSHFIWYTRAEVNTSHCSEHGMQRKGILKLSPSFALTRRAFCRQPGKVAQEKANKGTIFHQLEWKTRTSLFSKGAQRFSNTIFGAHRNDQREHIVSQKLFDVRDINYLACKYLGTENKFCVALVKSTFIEKL